MDKEIVNEVLERSQGRCEWCGSTEMVQLHHVIGGNGKRRQCESVDSVIALCWTHHHGTFGVHGREGQILSLQLKQRLEEKYREQGKDEEDIRYLLGGCYYL